MTYIPRTSTTISNRYMRCMVESAMIPHATLTGTSAPLGEYRYLLDSGLHHPPCPKPHQPDQDPKPGPSSPTPVATRSPRRHKNSEGLLRAEGHVRPQLWARNGDCLRRSLQRTVVGGTDLSQKHLGKYPEKDISVTDIQCQTARLGSYLRAKRYEVVWIWRSLTDKLEVWSILKASMTVQALIGMHFSAPSLCPSNHKWSAGTEYLESLVCTEVAGLKSNDIKRFLQNDYQPTFKHNNQVERDSWPAERYRSGFVNRE
ncbi:hypothetical protein EDD16DRAFT_1527515 [Pisolithus croceorrhizus]|nr:hypothetical protein EDD16DRAFT_1527515 [Pisolithus croceorrhizus]KAI6130190.1 hypothetical protein EV401DRAFT_2127029 [Pisolithus croceorrhizus]